MPFFKFSIKESFNFLILWVWGNFSIILSAITIGNDVDDAYSKQPVGILLSFSMASNIIPREEFL